MNFVTTTPSELNIIRGETEILHLFERQRIPVDCWGHNGFRSFDKLMQAIIEDQVDLEDTGGTPIIHVRNVVAFVRSMRVPDEELYEAHQRHPDGSIVERDFDGICETLARGENPDRGIIRLLAEEPGYSEPRFRDPRNYRIIPLEFRKKGPIPSEKWPGLDAIFYRNRFRCEIVNPAIYRPEGYHEERDGLVTFMRWTEDFENRS